MKKTFAIIFRLTMLLLTAFFALLMTCTAGAGLIYNGESYGAGMVRLGCGLIFSGILLTVGAILSLFRKRSLRIATVVCILLGLALCMSLLYLLCCHADSAGWSDNYTMEPVSGMYRRRILPVIVPSIMAIVSARLGVRSFVPHDK